MWRQRERMEEGKMEENRKRGKYEKGLVLSKTKWGSELVNTKRSGTGHKPLPAPKLMFAC